MRKPKYAAKKTDPLTDVNTSLPFSEDAEKGVLSCFLQDTEILNEAQVNLPPESFYHPASRQLYEVFLEFNEKSVPIDLVTLSTYLLDKGLMDKVGGPSVLPELLSFVPTPSHYPHYRGILAEKLRLRKMIGHLTAGIQMAYEYDKDSWTIIENTAAAIDEIRLKKEDEKPFEQMCEQFLVDWRKKVAGEVKTHLPTRWREWNEKIGGIPQGYILLKGPRKKGKSSLLVNIATDVAIPPDGSKPERSILFSYEMPEDQIIARIIADRWNIDGRYLFAPDDNPPTSFIEAKIVKAIGVIKQSPIRIVSDPTNTVEDILFQCRSWRPKFIGVDYLQIMPPPRGLDQGEGKSREVEENSVRLTRLAGEMKNTVMVLSQLKEDGEAAWSKGIENDATLALRLEKGRVVVDNRRNGSSGHKINIGLNGKYFRFEEQAPQED